MNIAKKCEICGKIHTNGDSIFCAECKSIIVELINSAKTAKEYVSKNPDKLRELQDKFR